MKVNGEGFLNILLVLCKLYECSHSAEGLSEGCAEGCAEGRNEVLLLFFACFFNFAFNNAKIRKKSLQPVNSRT